MSYVQIEIGGKLRGLKFNQYAIVTMAKYSDIDNYEATAGYAMIYGGLKANCYVKREEFEGTFEEVCDWVDSLTPEILIDVFNVFSETQVYKNLIDKGKVEEVTKKKSSKTGLKT